MSRVADSLKLGLTNLVGTAVAFLIFGTRYNDAGLVWTLAFIPPLLCITLAFTVRDLLTREKRVQALLAFSASVPPVLLWRWISRGVFHFH